VVVQCVDRWREEIRLIAEARFLHQYFDSILVLSDSLSLCLSELLDVFLAVPDVEMRILYLGPLVDISLPKLRVQRYPVYFLYSSLCTGC
jgi:hypothetical protein